MKIKKILVGILSMVCFGFSTLTLTSCGHQHVYNDGEIVTPATCTTDGEMKLTCTDCGEIKFEVITAKGHTEVVDEAVEATCTTTGLTEGKHCSECGEVFIYQQATPAKDHSYTAVITEPTCTTIGYTTHTCECGSSYVDSYVATLGHKEATDAAVAATCITTGLTEGKHCSECNEVLVAQEEIEMLEHNYINYVCDGCGHHFCTEGLEFTLSSDKKSYSVSNYDGADTSVVIPSIYNNKPVTKIENGAFRECSLLTNIEIPNSIIYIGDYAFYKCSLLTNIEIPGDVVYIGDSAFYNCVSLLNITIPNNLKSIGRDTFTGCKSLTSIIIPENVTTIGSCAFSDCVSLTSITIPNSVTYIDLCAFSGCSSLTSIEITSSVTIIGPAAFSMCSSLTEIIISRKKEFVKSSWIFIGNFNDSLTNATKIYNYQG